MRATADQSLPAVVVYPQDGHDRCGGYDAKTTPRRVSIPLF